MTDDRDLAQPDMETFGTASSAHPLVVPKWGVIRRIRVRLARAAAVIAWRLDPDSVSAPDSTPAWCDDDPWDEDEDEWY